MSQIWLTSDTHFGHTNIIRYCNRPFSAVEEMDDVLLKNMQVRINEDDFLVHLGDVTLIRKPWQPSPAHVSRSIDVICQIPGRKILVAGNHDMPHMRKFYQQHGWIVIDEFRFEHVLFTHVPRLKLPVGFSLNIHGHTHGNFSQEYPDFNSQSYIDVGVDPMNYVPVTASSVLGNEVADKLMTSLYQLFHQNSSVVPIGE